MQQRPLGDSGLHVSAIGFGAWQLANPQWGGADEAESVALVRTALDAGCNFFDTAPGYGDGASERLLGETLQGRRDEAVICTKFGHHTDDAPDFSAAALRPMLEASLRRLRTDRIDVLLLHNPPAAAFDGDRSPELYAELEALRRAGLIRVYGASLDWAADLRTLAHTTRSGAAEVLFNAFHQEPAGAFAAAAARSIGLIAKVPLDSGWLSGRYDAASRFDGIRARWTPAVIARRAALVDRLLALLPPGWSVRQAALAFILAHGAISTVIPGVKTRAQLAENLDAAARPAPPDLVTALRELWQTELAADPLPW